MEKIFIIWHDYDGNYVEDFVFDEKDKAANRCAKIMKKDNYGTQIDIVIQGKVLTMKTIKVVSEISLV